MNFEQSSQLVQFLSSPYIILFVIWEIVWKSIALWKSARHSQLYWFIALVIFNTVGILPIVYILFFQKDKKEKEKA